jgi:hypothetical protein
VQLQSAQEQLAEMLVMDRSISIVTKVVFRVYLCDSFMVGGLQAFCWSF